MIRRAALAGGGLSILVALGAAAQPPRQPTLEELGFPPRAEFAHATGSFAVRFATLPDSARPEAVLPRLRAGSPTSTDGGVAPVLALERELFFVHVPAGYSRETPHGLFVWISPTDFGGTVREDLRALLAERRWIWVGAHRSGNERALLDRHALALVAASEAPKSWTIDPARVVVAGYSGGGRTASQLALAWPELFRGGLFVMGCNWYEPLPVPGEPGRVWPASFPPPPAASLELARGHPLVFLTAERDFNRAGTLAAADAARAAGFRRAKTIEVPGIDHFGRPPIEGWREALVHLDAGAP